MFNLEFFKGKIDTTTIHEQAPPIDPEVVDSINRGIKEDKNKTKVTEETPKFYKTQILHDVTAYRGEWLNRKRHGYGSLFDLSLDNC